ncbi:MAG: hypothetical protein QOK23_1691 [Gammaproteobacteria bacterium]|jgi:uncharacterized LabA/DUF88 family protein|nr:nuclease [Gammaproteobacteria bacterium]MEA3139522.1 hypothetical protein [Gammaproteobacteria bacterium]
MAAARRRVRVTFSFPLCCAIRIRECSAILTRRLLIYLSEGELEDVAIFVDVQNIYYTTRQRYSRHFDYNKFWAQATRNRNVVKAVAFAIDRDDEKQKQFQTILRAIGFEVRLKPFIRRMDGTTKGDWDVGITLEVLEYAPLADVVVLATGDGDFDLLVHKIRERDAVSVEVYGVAELSAGTLIRAANRFIPIEDPLLLGIK